MWAFPVNHTIVEPRNFHANKLRIMSLTTVVFFLVVLTDRRTLPAFVAGRADFVVVGFLPQLGQSLNFLVGHFQLL